MFVITMFFLSSSFFWFGCDGNGDDGNAPRICWEEIGAGMYTLTLSAPEDSLLAPLGDVEVTLQLESDARVVDVEGDILVVKYNCFQCDYVDTVMVADVIKCSSETNTWSLDGSCLEFQGYCAECAAGEVIRFCLGTSLDDQLCNSGTWSKTISSESCPGENYLGSGVFTLTRN